MYKNREQKIVGIKYIKIENIIVLVQGGLTKKINL